MSWNAKLTILIIAVFVSHSFLYHHLGKLHKELDGVKAVQEQYISTIEFYKCILHDITMKNYIRLCNTIGEVYGLETELEQQRLIYWTLTITNGMPYAERRMRIRKGLDGK